MTKYVLIFLLLVPMLLTFTAEDLHYSEQVSNLCKQNSLTFFNYSLLKTGLGNSIQVIGISGQNRGPRSSYTDFKGEPAILITGAMHPKQNNSFRFIKEAVKYLIIEYGRNNHEIRYLLQRMVLLIIPLVNIDSIQYLIQHPNTTSTFRKNMNTLHADTCQKDQDRGVDINRNFPYNYGKLRTSADPCSEQYRGSKPFSQPEARAISMLYKVFKIKTNIDVHSYGNVWIYPYASQSDPNKIKQHQLYPVYERIFQEFGKREVKYSNCYQSLKYLADGVYIDWALEEDSISFALEFGEEFDRVGAEMEKHVRALMIVLGSNLAIFDYFIQQDEKNSHERALCIRSISTLDHELELLIDGKLVDEIRLRSQKRGCFRYDINLVNEGIGISSTNNEKKDEGKMKAVEKSLSVHVKIKKTELIKNIQIGQLKVERINRNQHYESFIKSLKIFLMVVGILYLIGSLCGLSVFCQKVFGIHRPLEQESKNFRDNEFSEIEDKMQTSEQIFRMNLKDVENSLGQQSQKRKNVEGVKQVIELKQEGK